MPNRKQTPVDAPARTTGAAPRSAAERASAPGTAFRPGGRLLDLPPRLLDVLVVALYGVPLGITRAVQLAEGAPGITSLHLVTAVASAAALLFRRRYPIAVLAAVTLLITVVTFSVDANNDLLAIPIALYAVAAFRSPMLAWPLGAAAILVAAGGLLLHQGELGPQRLVPWDFANLALLLIGVSIVAILLGTLTAGRRDRVAALEERTERLARERDNQATIAALAERSRIAREMHDIVAHSLSVMVALADGASAAVDTSPDSAKRALDRLGDTGRTALADMRRLLGVLGDSTAEPLRPAPARRDLPELVDRFRAAGLPVRFSETGTPPADPAIELALYRLVQEALTNALRYAADPTTVTVDVAHTDDRIVLTVVDDGRSPAQAAGRYGVGSGHGLVGMRERVALHGGTVESGPRAGGGWRVHAELPMGRRQEGGR